MQKLLHFHNDHRTIFRTVGTILAVALYPLLFVFLFFIGVYEAATLGREIRVYEHQFGEILEVVRPTWRDRLGTFLLILAAPFVLVWAFESFSREVFDTVDLRRAIVSPSED